MTLTELHYVSTLAEMGDLDKAAQHCQVSLPTLSIALKKLEDELALTLFERDDSQYLITAAGKAVCEQAKRVLSEAQRIHEIAEQHQGALQAPLSIACIKGAAHFVYEQLLPSLTDQQLKLDRQLPVYIEDADDNETLWRKLDRGRVDAILTDSLSEDLEQRTNRYQHAQLLSEPIVAVLPAEHRLTKSEQLSYKDLQNYPLILPNHRFAWRQTVTETLPHITPLSINEGTPSTSLGAGSSSNAMKAMVASQLGIALLPKSEASIASKQAQHLISRPISDLAIDRQLYLVWRSSTSRSQAVEALLNAASAASE